MREVVVGNLKNETASTNKVSAQLSEIVSQLRESRQSCVVIVDENQKPLGIFTERDLVRVVNEVFQSDAGLERPVAEVMTASPMVVRDTTPLFEALVVTQTHKIRHLPIVDGDGKLSGVLSYSDLAKAYEHIIEQQRTLLEKEVSARTVELKEINEQLKALSMEDALLGIGNRRSMDVDLSYTHSSAMRYLRPYSVVLFDLDYFKQYNDFYGHQAGDEALIIVANHISEAIRKSDRLYRYGGEELLLLLPETDINGSLIVSQRIVKNLYQKSLTHEQSPLGSLSMSGGIASLQDPFVKHLSWQSVLAAADKALYQAKQAGRNQVLADT